MSGIFSIIFTIVGFFLPVQQLRVVWWILAGVACSLAVFSLLYSERRRADKAEENLKQHLAASRPVLKGEVQQILLQSILNLDSPTREPVGVEVFAEVAIYNESDCSTTVRSYDLTLENEQGSYLGERRGGVAAFFLPDKEGRPQEGMSDLAATTGIHPLVKGVLRQGWLLFTVKGIDAETAVKSKLKLVVVDTWKTPHELPCSQVPILVTAEQIVGHAKSLLKRLQG